MNKRLRFVLGGAAIALAVCYLIFTGVRENSTYYLTVGEAAATEALGRAEVVRVKGTVRHASVERHASTLSLTFVLADAKRELPVRYRGVVPDLFAEDREIIVEGRLTPEGLVAETLLASCPSKYEPQEVAATRSR